MGISPISPMLAMFRSDEPNYQPDYQGKQLRQEDGNPQASLENLETLRIGQGLVVEYIFVRKQFNRALVQFTTGEQYLALGLSDPKDLATVASNGKKDVFEKLAHEYGHLPKEAFEDEQRLPTALDYEIQPQVTSPKLPGQHRSHPHLQVANPPTR